MPDEQHNKKMSSCLDERIRMFKSSINTNTFSDNSAHRLAIHLAKFLEAIASDVEKIKEATDGIEYKLTPPIGNRSARRHTVDWDNDVVPPDGSIVNELHYANHCHASAVQNREDGENFIALDQMLKSLTHILKVLRYLESRDAKRNGAAKD